MALRLATDVYQEGVNLTIISPHGHCDPKWFSSNQRFPDPAHLFVIPDHYIFRMLFSHGIKLDELGLQSQDNSVFEKDPRKIWKKFSESYYLFSATPTAM